jgi:hypothetical protein
MNPKNKITSIFFFKLIFTAFVAGAGLSTGASAQTSNYLKINSGIEHIASRDKGMSPLLYAGYGFYAGIGWDRITPKHTTELVLNLAMGMQRNKYQNPIDYRRGNLQWTIFYHREVDRKNTLEWGWHINNVFSHRFNATFVNFNDHYEYFSNIGPALRYRYPFRLNKREVYLTGSANVQLIGMMIRPSYTSSYPEGFLNRASSIPKSLVHSVRLAHPGNSINVGIRPSLVYPLKSGNKLSLGYNYEFYRLSSSNTVSQSGGTWFISLAARL